jgi:hypothetical protein
MHSEGKKEPIHPLIHGPGSLDGGDEELGAVGVGSSVGHGEEAGGGVLEGEVLVGELLTVDGLACMV